MKNSNINDSSGCYNNLKSQVDSIYKTTREGSFKTRARYLAACERFCQHLADYKLQKFANVSNKHIISYVEKLKAEGKSASTIKTDLSRIRYFYRHSGGKNILISNDKLNLEQRHYRGVDRSLTQNEINNIKIYSKEIGREDIYWAVTLSENFGLRIFETCRVRYSDLRQAVIYGELYTKGKGGRERYIPVRTEQQLEVLKSAISYANSTGMRGHDLFISNNEKGGVQREIRSIQNFFNNHQDKFADKNRTKINDTKKIKAEKISFHGIRAYYANNLYNQTFEETHDKRKSELTVSLDLGHTRTECSRIYIK